MVVLDAIHYIQRIMIQTLAVDGIAKPPNAVLAAPK